MSEIKDNSKIYYWIKLKTDFFDSELPLNYSRI